MLSIEKGFVEKVSRSDYIAQKVNALTPSDIIKGDILERVTHGDGTHNESEFATSSLIQIIGKTEEDPYYRIDYSYVNVLNTYFAMVMGGNLSFSLDNDGRVFRRTYNGRSFLGKAKYKLEETGYVLRSNEEIDWSDIPNNPFGSSKTKTK